MSSERASRKNKKVKDDDKDNFYDANADGQTEMVDPRDELLNLLESGDPRAFVAPTAPVVRDRTQRATPYNNYEAIHFPSTGKYSCAICFATNDAPKEREAATAVMKAHYDKCSKLTSEHDCLVCRVKLNPENKMEHFLSKTHTEKTKLLNAKLKSGDGHAFYYTEKGSGQTKPLDNIQYFEYAWVDKDRTVEFLRSHTYSKRQIYGYKISKSIASCKNHIVANLTYGSEAVQLLETLGMFATIGHLPCTICMESEETDVESILGAVKDGVPADKAAKFFDTKEHNARCQLCKKALKTFVDPAVVAMTCKSMKGLILKATQ